MGSGGVISEKKIGLFSVVSISVSGIIGSGWLFSAFIGAREAGAAVYLSWLIALLFFLLMAVALSEVIALFPMSGLIGRIGAVSHNRYFGSIFAFSIWLELVASMPGEAQASVQYLASLSPAIHEACMSEGSLTVVGLLVTFLFLVFYWLVNIFGLRFFARVNNAIAVYKVIIPVTTAVVIMVASFNVDEFTAYKGEWMPYDFSSVITAIAAAGMIYAFNGFQVATAFAAEVKNPAKTLPWGMVISLFICFGIYIVLQTAFIGALSGEDVARKGWHALNFDSPFVQLTTLLGLNFITLILYTDAFISPTGTGITFVGSAARVLYGMGAEHQAPKAFGHVDPKRGFSRLSMGFNFGVAVVFLVLFHSWAKLLLFITALIVLMYMVIPVAVMGMRHSFPDAKRAFRLPCARLICTVLFIAQTLVMYFIGAKDILALTIAATAFTALFIAMNRPVAGGYSYQDIFITSVPFLVFLWTVAVLLLLGPKDAGGSGTLAQATVLISLCASAVVAFQCFTSKWFVTKCSVMRVFDEKTLAVNRTD